MRRHFEIDRPPSGRGVIGRLESLVKVGSDRGRFSEEEEDAIAVVFLVSVASPIIVSRECKEGIGGLSEDKMLQSNNIAQSGVTAYSWVGAGGGEISSLVLYFAAELRFAFLLARRDSINLSSTSCLLALCFLKVLMEKI